MNWRKRLAEILARMGEIREGITEVEGIEAPTDEDATRAETLLTEWDTLEAERVEVAAKVERLDAVRAASLDPANVERGFDVPNVVTRKDPFEGMERVEQGTVSREDLRDRAMRAIDEAPRFLGSEDREVLAEHAERADVARHILLTSNPGYLRALPKILKAGNNHGMAFASLEADEREAVRAAMSTSGSAGGYAIPAFSDTSLIYTGTQIGGNLRNLATKKVGTVSTWKGLSSAGIVTYWKPEGSSVATQSNPTFAQPAITAQQGHGYAVGSWEILEDSEVLASLPSLFAEARADQEALAFLSGTGTGEPQGLLYFLGTTTDYYITTLSGTTNIVSTANIVGDFDVLSEALAARYEPNASVLANKKYFDTARNTTVAGQGTSVWNNFGAGIPPQMRGYNAYQESHMNSTWTTTGQVVAVLGDIASAFYIYDRLGSTIEPIPNVVNTSTGNPTGQRGMIFRFRSGSAVVNPNAAKLLLGK